MPPQPRRDPLSPEALDRRLRDAERAADELKERTDTHLERLGQLDEGHRAIRDDLGKLRKVAHEALDLVRKLSARINGKGKGKGGGDDEDKEPVVSWLVGDAGEITAKRNQVEKWIVNVLLLVADDDPQNELLTDCWRRHPATVERLFALFDGWMAAYEDGADPVRRLDWFNRHLPLMVKDIRKDLRNCGLHKHVQHNPADFQPRRLPGRDSATQVTIWWAESRGQQPEPPPSRDAIAEANARANAKLQREYQDPPSNR